MPLTPTITLTDNADGTGAVCAISGSTGGSTNEVFAASWAGGFVTAAFQSKGSRTGDGSVSLAMSAGYYWVYVKSTHSGDEAISLVKGVRVTSGEAAIHDQCLDAAVAKIQALQLPAPWGSEAVAKRKFPWNRGMLAGGEKALVLVTPINDRTRQVLNQSDDFELGCQITAAVKSNESLTEHLSADLLCREQLMNAFLPVAGQLPLAGVPEIYNVTVEPGPVIDPASFDRMYDVSAFIIRCFNRRTRGLA